MCDSMSEFISYEFNEITNSELTKSKMFRFEATMFVQ